MGSTKTARAIEDALRKDGLVPDRQGRQCAGRRRDDRRVAIPDDQEERPTGSDRDRRRRGILSDHQQDARIGGRYHAGGAPRRRIRGDGRSRRFRIKTLEDLIAKFKANPGSVAWGGGSPGSTENIFFARIAKAVGVDLKRLNFIPHPNTGEVVVSALSGQVAVAGGGWQDFETQVQAGKLRAIAVASPERIEGIDAPTLKEKGIDIVFSNWRGVSVHPSLTKEEVAAVGSLFAKLVKSRAGSRS